MVPPSSRDLDTSVDFLKDLLRNDTHSRSTNLDPLQSSSQPNKYAKVRSFNRNASPEPSTAGPRKDAAVYKHDDNEVKTYKPSSRHLDRRNVRFHGEDEGSDLGSLKKQLKATQDLLDRTYKDDSDDDDVDAEIEDLQYRIKRVQEDIEFSKSGRRTEGKDHERRRLERELLFLMHEKLPELEEKIRQRDRKKRLEDKSKAKTRDARNQRKSYGSRAYRERDGRSASDSEDEEDEQDERGYLRGSYGGQTSRSAEPKGVASPKSKRVPSENGRTEGDWKKHEAAPSPPPGPPAGAPTPRSPPPPPVSQSSTGTSTPVTANKKPQTAEERQAYIRAEAQRRVLERMRMLTGQSPASTPPPSEVLPSGYDSSLQARLEQDKREAAKRAEDDDKAASERERLRQIKLEEERQKKIRVQQDTVRDSALALQKISNEVTVSEMKHAEDIEAIASSAAHEELAREEKLNKEREQFLAAQQQESQERTQRLKAAPQQTPKTPPQPPAPRGHKAPPKPPPSRKQLISPSQSDLDSPKIAAAGVERAVSPVNVPAPPPSAPPAPPAPPKSTPAASDVASTPAQDALTSSASPPPKSSGSSTNPFHRLGAAGQGAISPANGAPTGTNNPFFRPPTGASVGSSTQNQSPVARFENQKTVTPKDEDWGDIQDLNQADSDDSDDEDGPNVKQVRAGLAGLLFGGASAPSSTPPSRPSSTAPEGPPSSGPPRAPAAPLPPL